MHQLGLDRKRKGKKRDQRPAQNTQSTKSHRCCAVLWEAAAAAHVVELARTEEAETEAGAVEAWVEAWVEAKAAAWLEATVAEV